MNTTACKRLSSQGCVAHIDGAVFQLDWLTDNEYKAVEKKLGPELFHFVQGNPTGHYKLQLGNPQHRMLVNKLVAISYEETLCNHVTACKRLFSLGCVPHFGEYGQTARSTT